jgi:antitoxin (DNA-binding transcriptional repressor) of toxin-antitoxin stability system
MVEMGLFETKTHLSRLVDDLLAGRNDCVRVLRRGKPAVQITPVSEAGQGLKIGAMKDEINLPEDFDATFDAMDAEVAALMLGTAP